MRTEENNHANNDHRRWLAGVLAPLGTAAAQEWPTHPITLIVPFAAGGGLDVSVRIQAQRMSELLGQTIIVENIGAAGGTVGICAW